MRCLFCGEREIVSIFEYWSSGEFLLETCCEGMRDEADAFMAEDPKAAAKWIETLGHRSALHDDEDEDDDLAAEPILPAGSMRRVIAEGGQLLLDFNLGVVPLPWAKVKAFVNEHHEHCPAPAGWRYGAGVMNGGQLVGVISVGRPVARAIDHTKVVEVNRLCVRRDVASGLVWNACSLLYGWAAREAKKRGFERIVTYTMEHEPGTTLKAAGWAVEGKVAGRSWNAPSRPRKAAATAGINKVRWARELRA